MLDRRFENKGFAITNGMNFNLSDKILPTTILLKNERELFQNNHGGQTHGVIFFPMTVLVKNARRFPSR